MKTFKRFSAILIAVFLMVSMMVIPASAAGEYSITVHNEAENHTYEAYQIFSGVVADGGILTQIAWGEGVTSAVETEFGDAATKAASLSTTADALAFAAALEPYLNEPYAHKTSDRVQIEVSGATTDHYGYVISGLDGGYYLVRDKSGTLVGVADAHTTFILHVAGNITVDPKDDMPTIEKKVYDAADFTGDIEAWQDSTDHSIGEQVKYMVTLTLPDDYSIYDSPYTFIVHDTASGLDLSTLAIDKVTVFSSNTATTGTEITSGYNLNMAPVCSDRCSFHIEFADLKQIPSIVNNGKIEIEYHANLADNATLGEAGNLNSVKLEYSNDPYGTTLGKTNVADTVEVYSYKLNINKLDHDGKDLAGASFKLEKKESDNSWSELSLTTVDTNTFSFSGLDEGIYKLTETTIPAGYEPIQPFYFRINATYNALSDDPALQSLTVIECTEDGNSLSTDEKNSQISFLTPNMTTGDITVNITNRAGNKLPETGGIGTTIFYGIGGVLVLGALSLLIVRKRSTAK